MSTLERATTVKNGTQRFQRVIAKLRRYPAGTILSRNGEVVKMGDGHYRTLEERNADIRSQRKAQEKISNALQLGREDSEKLARARQLLAEIKLK